MRCSLLGRGDKTKEGRRGGDIIRNIHLCKQVKQLEAFGQKTCVCSAYAHCSALTDGRLQRSRAWAMKKKVFTQYSSASLRPMALSVATALLALSWLCMGKCTM